MDTSELLTLLRLAYFEGRPGGSDPQNFLAAIDCAQCGPEQIHYLPGVYNDDSLSDFEGKLRRFLAASSKSA